MADYRATFFFETVQQAKIGHSSALGWTESWYLGNVPGGIESVFGHQDVLKYRELRLGTLSSVYRMPWLRVNDDANPRLVKVASLGLSSGTWVPPAGRGPPQTQCAILVDFQRLPDPGILHDKVHHRRWLMRGLPATTILGNVINTENDAWKAILAFLDFVGKTQTPEVPARGVFATNLGMRYHDPRVLPTNITALSATGTDNQFLSVQPDIPALVAGPPGVGNRVQLRDVPAPFQRANRIWTLLSRFGAAPNVTMTLGKSRRTLPQDVLATGLFGQMIPVSWLYGVFSQYAVIGLRTKKTGRIFHQPRGRSSGRG